MKDFVIVVLLLLCMTAYYFHINRTDELSVLTSVLSERERNLSDQPPLSEAALSQTQGAPNRALPESLDADENLLVNGDFERNLLGWDYDAGVYFSDNGGENESGALLLNPPEIIRDSKVIYAKKASQCIPIDGAAIYAIEASFRYLEKLPMRPSVNRAHLYWYEGLNCSSGGQYATYLEPNLQPNEWQRLLKGDLRPALGARSLKVVLEQRQDHNNNADAIWDNLVLVETARTQDADYSGSGSEAFTLKHGENYLKNGGFDQGITHWARRETDRLKWRLLDDDPQAGVMAATLPNERDSSIGTGSFDQCVNFGTETRFELGAKVMQSLESDQRGGGRLRPTWYENLDCRGRYQGSNQHADVDKSATGWQSLRVDELRPALGSKSVRISIIHSIEGRGSHTLFWDDIYFRAY